MKRFNLAKATGYGAFTPPHFVLNLSFSLFLIFVCCSGELRAQPRLDKSGWRCVFSENFDTPVQGRPNDWSTEITHGNFQEGNIMYHTDVQYRTVNGQTDAVLKSYVNQTIFPVTYNGGLTTHPCYYHSGIIRTQHDDYRSSGGFYPVVGYPSPDINGPGGWLYGMFEVRCKLPKHRGTAHAIWLHANNNRNREIDIIESSSSYNNDGNNPVHSPGNVNQVFSSVHFPVPGTSPEQHDLCFTHTKFPFSLSEEFHTYTIVWTPFEIAFFLDSAEIKTVNDPDMVTAHVDKLRREPIPTLIGNMQDFIIHNWTNGNPSYRPLDTWDNFYMLGITELSDMIVDKVEIFRPETLSVSLGSGYAPAPMPLSNRQTMADDMQLYVDNVLIPAYRDTPFRAVNGWQQEYVGYDIQEYTDPWSTPDVTLDYKIIGKPVMTKGGDEGFFFVDGHSGLNILSYGMRSPTAANPKRYEVVVIDEIPLDELEIAGHRAKSIPYLKHNPGALTVYYRRGGSLWTATSFDDGKTWDKREVTEAAEWPIGGEMNCDVDKTDEIVIYRSSNNELIELKRRIFSYSTFGSVENLTMYAQDALNPNNGAPQDVASYLTFDPVESNIYYYKTLDGMGIGTLYLGPQGWTYQNISVKGGVDMLKPTAKWDNTWRRILYTNGTSGMLRALDPTNLVQEDIIEFTGPQSQLPLTYVRDFVAGYNHAQDQQNSEPKNIYFSDWTDNKLYMLRWDLRANSYVRSDIKILGEGFAQYSFGNMQPTDKDLPTFYRTTDGHLRKLTYGPQAPRDHLLCNKCLFPPNDPNNCYPVPIFPINQNNGPRETNAESADGR